MEEHLVSRDKCAVRLRENWPAFLERREQRLVEQERHGKAAERVTEEIIADLFTLPLDWMISDLNHQVGYADLLLMRLSIKCLIVEAKRPGVLAWHQQAVQAALDQALRYAHEQKVHCVAVSDGIMLYAADAAMGGLRDRLFVSLEAKEPPEDLWWLSVHGIYRPRMDMPSPCLLPTHLESGVVPAQDTASNPLHPHYKLPARCFAYVGDPSRAATWKLPYLHADGSVDLSRLPKAVQAILSNYRGAKVESVPEKAIPDVLVRLGWAAAETGKLPHQAPETAPAYHQLVEALDQLGRLNEVTSIIQGAKR